MIWDCTLCVTSNKFSPHHIILCNYDGSLLVQCARFILLGTLFIHSNKIALWCNQVEIGSWCLPTLMRSHGYILCSSLYVTMFQLMATSKLKVFVWSICKKEPKKWNKCHNSSYESLHYEVYKCFSFMDKKLMIYMKTISSGALLWMKILKYLQHLLIKLSN